MKTEKSTLNRVLLLLGSRVSHLTSSAFSTLLASQMTHYTLIHYALIMHYVLNCVVYELYKVILSFIIWVWEPLPLYYVIKSGTLACIKCSHFVLFFRFVKYIIQVSKGYFFFLEFSVWTHTTCTTKQHRVMHKYVNWDAPNYFQALNIMFKSFGSISFL